MGNFHRISYILPSLIFLAEWVLADKIDKEASFV